jgi:hypothetical protein
MVVCITVKSVDDVIVFPLTVTVIFPVVAASGTATTSSVVPALITGETVPLNFTMFSDGTVEKFEPVIVTVVPVVPDRGAKAASVVCNTVKSVDDVAVFPLTITVIFPVVAVCGTVATNAVVVALVIVAAAPLNATWLEAAVELKLSPEIVTLAPVNAEPGVKLAIIGSFTVVPLSSSLQQSMTIEKLAINKFIIDSFREVYAIFIRLG